MPSQKRRCSRCYQPEGSVRFSGNRKQCDTCHIERTKGAVVQRGAHSQHYNNLMKEKPTGDPVLFAARRAGLDYDILMKITQAQKVVCDWMTNNEGAYPKKLGTPMDVAEEIVPRKKDMSDQQWQALQVTYLSASMDAATWLGWFKPYSRR